jgi:hypothetical protein
MAYTLPVEIRYTVKCPQTNIVVDVNDFCARDCCYYLGRAEATVQGSHSGLAVKCRADEPIETMGKKGIGERP